LSIARNVVSLAATFGLVRH